MTTSGIPRTTQMGTFHQAVPAWELAATLGQSENLRKRGNPRRDGRKFRENRKKKTVEENARVEAVYCVRSAYGLRTIPVRSTYFPRMPCIRSPCCRNLNTCQKREPQNWGLSETRSSRSVQLSVAWCGDLRMTRRQGIPESINHAGLH